MKVYNVEEEIDKIKVSDRKIEEYNNIIKNKRDILEKANNKKEEIIKELNILEVELGKIVEAGKEKKNFIDKEEEEIRKLNIGKFPKNI